ncbi:MAG: ribonuclease P protein component [Alphaproteobacteria bacterium]
MPKVGLNSLPSKDTKIITLKKRHEFSHVRHQGKKVVTKSFILQGCAPATEIPVIGPRFGFIVTKKIGNAVIRNRIKRRFRALLQEQQKRNLIPALDYVLISKANCYEEPFENLKQALKWAFSKYDPPLTTQDSTI